MSSVTEVGMDGASGKVQRTERLAVGEREVRWSARRKEGVVMRLLRGESRTCWPGRPVSLRGGSRLGVRSSWSLGVRG